MNAGERLLKERGIDPNAKEPAPPRPPPNVPPLGVYDESSGRFWTSSPAGRWTSMGETQFSRLLRASGLNKNGYCTNGLTEVEHALLQLQQHESVQWAGDLAGWPSGLHTISGQRVLVVTGPSLVKPKRGPWKTLRWFFESLLGDEVFHLFNWLHCALQAMAAGYPWREGQAFAIAGPARSGKSLTQRLITKLLGGRSAKPFRYLAGETAFNRDLFGAEHLMLEDDASELSRAARRKMSANLKTLVANELHSLHAKGRDALTLPPFWRVSFSLNDEPDYLGVLPYMDASIKDKIFLLRASKVPMPFTDGDLQARHKFGAALDAELPAFAAYLRSYRVPAEWQDPSFGCRSFHDPLLLSKLADLEDEFIFLELIDRHLWVERAAEPWEGSASELESVLRTAVGNAEINRICPYNTACGVQLGKLAAKTPNRVQRLPGRGHKSHWRIYHPANPGSVDAAEGVGNTKEG